MKTMMRLIKIDEEKRIVIGRATEEIADKADEILDYASSKPEFEKWSADIEKASKGKSKGNVREMHGNKVAGTVQQLLFLDAEKAIDMHVKVVADDAWKMVKEGGYTGFSIGGSYIRKWADPDNSELTRFTPRVVEVSLVDNPCVPTATFEAIKADGTIEIRKFQPKEKIMEPEQVWKATDGQTFSTKAECVAYNESLVAKGALQPAADAIAKLEASLGKAKEDETEEEKTAREKQEKEDAEKAAKDNEIKDKEEADKKEKNAAARASIKKSLAEAWDSRQALDALVNLECLLLGEQEDGEGEQVDDIEEAIARLKTFIASEIMEGSEKAAKIDELKKIAPAEMHAALDALKAGARHSAADMDHLNKCSKMLNKAQDAHDKMGDHLMEMHKCMKGLGMEGHEPEADEEMHEKMAKLAANSTATTDLLAKAVAAIEAVPGALAGKDAEIAELKKRLGVVERQPLPRKSAGEHTAVTKGDEGNQPVEVEYKQPSRYIPGKAE